MNTNSGCRSGADSQRPQDVARRRQNRNRLITVALAQDPDQAGTEINVLPFQADQFVASQPQLQRDLDHRFVVVAQAFVEQRNLFFVAQFAHPLSWLFQQVAFPIDSLHRLFADVAGEQNHLAQWLRHRAIDSRWRHQLINGLAAADNFFAPAPSHQRQHHRVVDVGDPAISPEPALEPIKRPGGVFGPLAALTVMLANGHPIGLARRTKRPHLAGERGGFIFRPCLF